MQKYESLYQEETHDHIPQTNPHGTGKKQVSYPHKMIGKPEMTHLRATLQTQEHTQHTNTLSLTHALIPPHTHTQWYQKQKNESVWRLPY